MAQLKAKVKVEVDGYRELEEFAKGMSGVAKCLLACGPKGIDADESNQLGHEILSLCEGYFKSLRIKADVSRDSSTP